MDVQEASPAGGSAVADPVDCKLCPYWRDSVGRCSVPESERRCGWTPASGDLGPQPPFALFARGH